MATDRDDVRRPTPAKGQRWRCDDETADERVRGGVFTLLSVDEAADYFTSKWDDGMSGSGRLSWLLSRCTYLGGPRESTGPVAWAAGQRRRGKIFGNVDGGGGVEYDGEYVVRDRATRSAFDWIVDVPGDYWFACEAWPSELLGAAPAVTVPPARAPEPTPFHENLAPVAVRLGFSEDYHRGTGVPLTALEKIQSRKPPEPWRPSVTDEDLLPDSPGTFRSGR